MQVECSSLDFGVPWLMNERTLDGVHFNENARLSLERMLGRVIRSVMGAGV